MRSEANGSVETLDSFLAARPRAWKDQRRGAASSQTSPAVLFSGSLFPGPWKRGKSRRKGKQSPQQSGPSGNRPVRGMRAGLLQRPGLGKQAALARRRGPCPGAWPADTAPLDPSRGLLSPPPENDLSSKWKSGEDKTTLPPSGHWGQVELIVRQSQCPTQHRLPRVGIP